MHTAMQSRDANPIAPGSLRKRKRLTKYEVPYVATLIQLLFGAGNPAAVFWRIRAVVIDAVKGVPDRANAHVSKKVGERFQPVIADDNSAPAIVGIFFPILGVAAPLHFSPASHGRSVGHAMLNLFAAAAFRPTRPQVSPQNSSFGAANAPAKAAASGGFKHCPIVHLHGATIRRGNKFIKVKSYA